MAEKKLPLKAHHQFVPPVLPRVVDALGYDPADPGSGSSLAEPPIAPGTTSQWWRGDKTWQALPGNQTITLSGDVTGSGTTAITVTFATVNSNTGTYGGAATVPQISTNGKGLITSVTAVPIAIAWSAIISGKPTTLAGYGITNAEGTIAAGTTAQYWRGDKTWQTLDRTAVGLGATTSPNFAGISYTEIAALPTAAADTEQLFAVDVGGITSWRAQSPTGLVTDVFRDQSIIVRNETGATITKGSVVYEAGVSAASFGLPAGRLPLVARAQTGATTTMPAIGVMMQDVANNSQGRMMRYGMLLDVDTSAFTAGQRLYVSSVLGGLTATMPTDYVQRVAFCIRSHATLGQILVDISPMRLTTEGSLLRSGGTTGQVLRKTSVTDWATEWWTPVLANDEVTNLKLADMTAATIKGRALGAGTGDPTDLTAAQVRTLLALVVGTNVQAWDADNDAVAASGIAGVWTSAVCAVAAGSGTFTSASATIRYVKVGRVVICELYMGITTNGTAASYIDVTLPFASRSLGSGRHQGCSGQEVGTTGFNVGATILDGTSTFRIRKYDATYPGASGNAFSFLFAYEAAT
jgi:hypothetical protein